MKGYGSPPLRAPRYELCPVCGAVLDGWKTKHKVVRVIPWADVTKLHLIDPHVAVEEWGKP